MQPTPHADTLVAPIRQALELLRSITRQQAVFDPAKAQRTFRICMTDITPSRPAAGAHQPPERRRAVDQVEITHISAQTPKMLESGEADLAVGFMPQLEAGFYQQKLFDQNFACVVRASTRGCIRG